MIEAGDAREAMRGRRVQGKYGVVPANPRAVTLMIVTGRPLTVRERPMTSAGDPCRSHHPWLTMTTGSPDRSSSAVKSRPNETGAPNAEK